MNWKLIEELQALIRTWQKYYEDTRTNDTQTTIRGIAARDCAEQLENILEKYCEN